MHIVFAASECVPYVKTGGVAEVVGALPKELVRQGHQVTVYVPSTGKCKSILKNAGSPFAVSPFLFLTTTVL